MFGHRVQSKEYSRGLFSTFRRGYRKPEILEDYPYPGKPGKRGVLFKCLLMILLVLAASMLWHRAYAADNSGCDSLQANHQTECEWRLEDVKAGQLLTRTDQPGVYHNVLIQRSSVHFDISGMVSNAQLRQVFVNDSNQWLEGVYVFPLPETAAVHRMQIKVGERIIDGTIKEKQLAKKIYQQAREAGKRAGLVEQQRPNMFTTHIANIAPGESVEVSLEYIEQIEYQHGNFSLRFPMTITPRYIPGISLAQAGIDADGHEPGLPERTLITAAGMGWAFDTDQVPDASHITPWQYPPATHPAAPHNPIEITATIDMAMPLNRIDSAYHSITLARNNHHYKVRLTQQNVAMDRDFFLVWQPVAGHSPVAALFTEQVEDEHYGLMMILPPAVEKSAAVLSREVIYVIDTSGSMGGDSMQQARRSLLLAMDLLTPGDRFNIIEFNSTSRSLFPSVIAATPQNIRQAKAAVSRLRATGGTEMLSAIRLALADQKEAENSTQSVRQVIFITDGAVGNEAALFQEIHNKLGASRLFTVGIGSAPNSFFMRKAAQFGRGSFTHIGDTREVQEKMQRLFAQLSTPVMRDIQLTWPAAMEVDMYPKKIPDLYQGQPIVVSVKLNTLSGQVVASGLTESHKDTDKDGGGASWQRALLLGKHSTRSSAAKKPLLTQPDSGNQSVNQQGGDTSAKGVAKLWAREKIAALLDEKTMGRDPQEVRSDVLTVALQHQLISPYTSFVAVDKLIVRPDHADLKISPVANNRPAGQTMQAFAKAVAYPSTATRGELSLLIALLLALFSGLLYQCSRGNHDSTY